MRLIHGSFLAALMADAGSEVLLLIRMMDSEELDTTAMCGAINDFFPVSLGYSVIAAVCKCLATLHSLSNG